MGGSGQFDGPLQDLDPLVQIRFAQATAVMGNQQLHDFVDQALLLTVDLGVFHLIHAFVHHGRRGRAPEGTTFQSSSPAAASANARWTTGFWPLPQKACR